MRNGIWGWVVCLLLLASCGGYSPIPASAGGKEPAVPPGYAGQTNPFGPQGSVAGAVIFKANCVPCHGEQGLGDGPASQSLDPRPANLAAIQKEAGDDFLYWRISSGVAGTAMPAWKGILSDEQIWDLVAFLRTLP